MFCRQTKPRAGAATEACVDEPSVVADSRRPERDKVRAFKRSLFIVLK